jgi:shikimate kinase
MTNNNHIILIGFMACGKTFTGRELLKRTGFPFIDTDDEIVKKVGMPISQIFEEKGEDYFRDVESEVCEKLKKHRQSIISTGGGIILREKNRRALKKLGTVFLLWASPEKILERSKLGEPRPLLQVPDPLSKIEEMLVYREAFYRETAHVVLDSDVLSIEEMTDEILNNKEFI